MNVKKNVAKGAVAAALGLSALGLGAGSGIASADPGQPCWQQDCQGPEHQGQGGQGDQGNGGDNQHWGEQRLGDQWRPDQNDQWRPDQNDQWRPDQGGQWHRIRVATRGRGTSVASTMHVSTTNPSIGRDSALSRTGTRPKMLGVSGSSACGFRCDLTG